MNFSYSKGFTLLEVLVAVSITAIIGVSATQLLSSIVQSKERTLVRSEQLMTIQRFNQVISRDVEQFVARSIRDEYDAIQADVTLNNGDYYWQFSRLGWRNSPVIEDPRSHIQRVAYQIEPLEDDACKQARAILERWQTEESAENCLVRYYWDVLDRSESTPKSQMLLPSVKEFNISLLVRANKTNQDTISSSSEAWVSDWPSVDAAQLRQYPVALKAIINISGLGEITRLWPLAHTREAYPSL